MRVNALLHGREELGPLAVALRRVHLDDYPPAVLRVLRTPDELRGLESVNHPRDRARRHSQYLGELAGRHRSPLEEEAAALRVGHAHAHPVSHSRMVKNRGGAEPPS